MDRRIAKDDLEPQYRFDVESNILWVDTLYWTFKTDLGEMEVHHRIYSKYVKFSYLPGKFYLDFEKISSDKFILELVREIDDPEPKSGYCFQVSFNVVASQCPRKVTYMNYDINNAPVHLTLRELISVHDMNDEWMIKCVVWMREYSVLNNGLRKEQQRLWNKKLKENSPEYQQYEQMAFIMGRESFKGLFSGRQDLKFAEFKINLLLRSFRYSDKLLTMISRHQKKMKSNESLLDLGRLLGYIKTGQERCISNKDCILLYASAFYCGLSYLKLQCSEYIKMNLEDDVDFFIDVMTIADMVNDKELMNYASKWFIKNKIKVLKSVCWHNFRNRNYELARGFKFYFLKYEFSIGGRVELQHVKNFIRLEETT